MMHFLGRPNLIALLTNVPFQNKISQSHNELAANTLDSSYGFSDLTNLIPFVIS